MLWWRKVRNHTYWTPGADEHSEGASYYVHDVALRRQHDEQGLSLYAVGDEAEANRVAHYYALTQMGCDTLDYLLIPDGPWTTVQLTPTKVPVEGIHPYLSDHHYEAYGLNPDLEAVLAVAILADRNRIASRLTKRAVLSAAPAYLDADGVLRELLHEEWEAKLFPGSS